MLVGAVLRQNAQGHSPCEHRNLEKKLDIHQGVFPSDIGEGSLLLLKHFKDKKKGLSGKRVLEIGTGCGAIAIMAAKQGAKRVVAVEYNKEAYKNAELNVAICGFQYSVDTKPSDLFDGLNKDMKFDLIVFNPPFIGVGWEIGAVLDAAAYLKALFDQSGDVLERFLGQAPQYLNPQSGRIILAYSDHMKASYVRNLTDKYGYKRTYVRSDTWSYGESEEHEVPFTFFLLELTPKSDQVDDKTRKNIVLPCIGRYDYVYCSV